MTEQIKKQWKVRSINNKTDVAFRPIFELNTSDGTTSMGIASRSEKDVECTRIEMEFYCNGKKQELVFNFLDLFTFIYFCANEELRQQLQMRYEKQVNYIPYDVTFKVDKDELQSGFAKRRIELPVDELTMAIARNEAWKLQLRGKVDITKNKR